MMFLGFGQCCGSNISMASSSEPAKSSKFSLEAALSDASTASGLSDESSPAGRDSRSKSHFRSSFAAARGGEPRPDELAAEGRSMYMGPRKSSRTRATPHKVGAELLESGSGSARCFFEEGAEELSFDATAEQPMPLGNRALRAASRESIPEEPVQHASETVFVSEAVEPSHEGSKALYGSKGASSGSFPSEMDAGATMTMMTSKRSMSKRRASVEAAAGVMKVAASIAQDTMKPKESRLSYMSNVESERRTRQYEREFKQKWSKHFTLGVY